MLILSTTRCHPHPQGLVSVPDTDLVIESDSSFSVDVVSLRRRRRVSWDMFGSFVNGMRVIIDIEGTAEVTVAETGLVQTTDFTLTLSKRGFFSLPWFFALFSIVFFSLFHFVFSCFFFLFYLSFSRYSWVRILLTHAPTLPCSFLLPQVRHGLLPVTVGGAALVARRCCQRRVAAGS